MMQLEATVGGPFVRVDVQMGADQDQLLSVGSLRLTDREWQDLREMMQLSTQGVIVRVIERML